MLKRRTKMFAAIFAVLAYLMPAASLPPQGFDRTVYIERQTRMYPVTIERITVGSQVIQPGVMGGPKVIQPGTPFQANNEWLKNMSFVLKNRTSKTIDSALIYLVFPDVQPGLNCSLEIGRMPANDFFMGKGQKPQPHTAKDDERSPLSLASGQTLVFKLADHIDEIQSCVEAFMPFPQVTRIAIEPHDFFFQDGMRWNNMEGFGIPDPNQPGKFTNRDRGSYFPGDPFQNWPPAAAPSQE